MKSGVIFSFISWYAFSISSFTISYALLNCNNSSFFSYKFSSSSSSTTKSSNFFITFSLSTSIVFSDILNDVWAGLYDGDMLALAAEKKVPIMLMHNQKEESYQDITQDVCDFLSQRAQAALEAGVPAECIWLDPGFGFAKNEQQNVELLKGLDKVCQLGFPVLFGISRKRTVDYLLGGGTLASERDMGTAALSAWAIAKGCQMVRVHNVDLNRDLVRVISQLV